MSAVQGARGRAMTDGEVAYRVPDSEWTPDERVREVSRFVQVAVQVAGVVALFWCAMQTKALWAVPVALAVYFLTGVLHEVGHALGAVLSGATITRAQVGPIEIVPLRGGLRMRWKRGPRDIGGLVQSFPSPHKSFRRQMIVTIVAGPLVNAVLAVGAFLLAHGRLDSAWGVMLLGIAAFNAGATLANLLPWASPTMLASDGWELMRWMRRKDEGDPQFAIAMLNARLISGEPFGPWADRYLRVMERSTQPGPMFVLWVRLKTLQMEGDWAGVDDVMRQVELQIIGLSPPVAQAMAGFIAIMRCEAAFSRAMAGEALERSPVEVLGPDMGWLFPAVRLRCQALECLRYGHVDMARTRLAESEYWSKRAIDRSLEEGEVVMRAAIASRLDGAGQPA